MGIEHLKDTEHRQAILVYNKQNKLNLTKMVSKTTLLALLVLTYMCAGSEAWWRMGITRCGGRSYNTRSQVCCNGRIQPRRDSSASCCGAVSYDPRGHVCCNRSVLQPRRDDM